MMDRYQAETCAELLVTSFVVTLTAFSDSFKTENSELHKKFSSYCAVNSFRLGYKNKSVSAVYGNNHYLL